MTTRNDVAPQPRPLNHRAHSAAVGPSLVCIIGRKKTRTITTCILGSFSDQYIVPSWRPWSGVRSHGNSWNADQTGLLYRVSQLQTRWGEASAIVMTKPPLFLYLPYKVMLIRLTEPYERCLNGKASDLVDGDSDPKMIQMVASYWARLTPSPSFRASP